jgi:hypothetical protein
MYYEKGQTTNATRLYEDLQKQFPDSPYSAKVSRRLGDIQMRLPYDMYDPPKYQPYKIPESLDFGSW